MKQPNKRKESQQPFDFKISKKAKKDDPSKNIFDLAKEILLSNEFAGQIQFLEELATPDGAPFPELKLLSSSDLFSPEKTAGLTTQQFLQVYESQMDNCFKTFSHFISEGKVSELVSGFKTLIERKEESSIIKFSFLFYILGVDCFGPIVEKEKARNCFFFKSKTLQGFMLDFGRSEVLQELIKEHQLSGVNDWRNTKGESVAHMAVLRDDKNLLEQILVFMPELIDVADLVGNTSIEIAAYYRRVDLLKLMISFPLVAYWRGRNKQSILHLLCSWDDAFE